MTRTQDSNQPEIKQTDKPQSAKPQRVLQGRTAIFAYDLVVIALLILVGALYICFPTHFTLARQRLSWRRWRSRACGSARLVGLSSA